jgi:hypothetical protein
MMEELLDLRSVRVFKAEKSTVEVGPDATPLDLFYAVFRNNSLPLQTRLRAAECAASYVHPKLSAVLAAAMSEGEFGDALERARKRLSAGPAQVQGQVEPLEGPRTAAPRPLPRPGLPGSKTFLASGKP